MHFCLGTTPTVQQTMVFDHVALDEVNRAVEVGRASSGKSINVARVLHTLGEAATVCVPVGGDTGRFILEHLAAEGIGHNCVEIVNPTRTCVTVIDRQRGTAMELVEEHAVLGEGAADKLLNELRAYLPRCRSLVLSGTLAPGAGEDFYARCCEIAAGAAPIILDARGEALMRALAMRPLVVKPNRAELSATLGVDMKDDGALREAIKELVRRGAQWVVVTMGKNGAVASDGKAFWKIPAIAVKAISAIGSGDSFSAGLATDIARGKEVPEACLLGAACAAANTLVPGAGYLRLEDVQRLRPLARLEKM